MQQADIAYENPFSDDPDRRDLWDMIVLRNTGAFAVSDWSKVAGDFDEERFQGVHANSSTDFEGWILAYPTVESFRQEWLRLSDEIRSCEFCEPLSPAIMRSVKIDSIDVSGDVATVNRRYEGTIKRAEGNDYPLDWRSRYFCRRTENGWKIVGMVGFIR